MQLRVLVCSLLFCFFGAYLESVAQISAPSATQAYLTNYNIAGQLEDSIYIFCKNQSLELNAQHPTTNTLTYNWYKYDATLNKFTQYAIENSTSSSISNLSEGGYRVVVTENGNFLACDQAWVFQDTAKALFNVSKNDCDSFCIAAEFSAIQNFTYYLPPKNDFIYDANTSIEICLNITHDETYQLGYVLEGPASCGSPTAIVHPDAASINTLTACFPSITNATNLCFHSDSLAQLSFNCSDLSIPSSGTHAWWNASNPSPNYPTNATPNGFIGCNVQDPGWSLSILDSENSTAENGILHSATITFKNNNPLCYDSTHIISTGTINQNFTSTNNFSTAAKFNIPSTPATLQSAFGFSALPNTSFNWSENNPGFTINTPNNASLKLSSIDQDTWFYLSYNQSPSCTYVDSFFYESPIDLIDTTVVTSPICFEESSGEISIQSTNTTNYSIDSGLNWQTSNTFSNLFAGSYLVVAQSAQQCYDSIEIELLDTNQITPNLKTLPVTCKNGSCNAKAWVSPTGSFAPFQVQWSPLPFVNTDTLFSICQGNYTVSITDAKGCTLDSTFSVSFVPSLTFDLDLQNSSCTAPSGSLQVMNLNNVNPPLSYLWNTGATSNNIINLDTGLYSLTVTDGNACDTVLEGLAIEFINPPNVSLNYSDTTLCFGSSLDLMGNIQNGTMPFSYLWNNGQTSEMIATNDTTALCYGLEITDANGCSDQSEIICIDLHAPITSADSLLINTCNGAIFNYTAEGFGGHPDSTLNYLWIHNQSNNQIEQIQAQGSFPDQDFYDVVISDGCSTEDTLTFVFEYFEIPNFDFTSSLQNGCAPLETHLTNNTDLSILGFTQCVWIIDSIATIGGACDSTVFTFQNPGIYDVGLALEYGNSCYDTLIKPSFVRVFESPTAGFNYTLQAHTLDEFNQNILLENTSLLSSDFEWMIESTLANNNQTIESDQEQFTANLDELQGSEFEVKLIVSSDSGCSDSTSKIIRLEQKQHLFIPTAFSPNEDFLNDAFNMESCGIDTSSFSIEIYNRWSNLVYESSDLEFQWTGHDLKQRTCDKGLYLWQIKYKDLNGETIRQTGYVQLIK